MTRRDFTPKSVTDIVVSSLQSRATLERLTKGQYPLPNDRSTVILISGPNGSGKTCLARLLPQAIEYAYGRGVGTDEPVSYRYVDCISGSSGRTIMERLEDLTNLVTPATASRHYIICDEIDNLSEAAQEQLYELCYRTDIIWIFTTNHRSKIDYRLLSLAVDILLDAPNDAMLAALATDTAAQFNVRLSIEQAALIAKLCSGSWRQVVERTLQCIGHQLRPWEIIRRHSDRARLLAFGSTQRPIKTLHDLRPQYLDELIFADSESAHVAARVVTGITRPPVDRAMGILIYGSTSTGRKLLAALIPKNIEALAYENLDPLFECDTLICKEGVEGLTVMRQLKQLLANIVIGNRSGLRYITLIDIEALSAGAQLDLKSMMNTPGVIFILVANEIRALNPGVLDRCPQRIYMPWPSIDQRRTWVEQAAKVLHPNIGRADIEALQTSPVRGFRALLGAMGTAGNAVSNTLSTIRQLPMAIPNTHTADTLRIEP